MHPFEQIVEAWTALPNMPLKLPTISKAMINPIEEKLLGLLKANTCPVRGMTMRAAAQSLGVKVGELRLPVKTLRIRNLVYSKPGPDKGVSKFWVAY
jgi:hypothetical protein